MNVLKPHVSLNVSNIDASVAFYEKVFGVAATKRRPGYAKFDLESPSLNLTMAGGAAHGRQRQPLRHPGRERRRTSRSRLARFKAAGLEDAHRGEHVVLLRAAGQGLGRRPGRQHVGGVRREGATAPTMHDDRRSRDGLLRARRRSAAQGERRFSWARSADAAEEARRRGARHGAAARHRRRLGDHGRAARGRERRDRAARQHDRDRRRARRADPHVRPDLGRALQPGGDARRRQPGRPPVARGARSTSSRRSRAPSPASPSRTSCSSSRRSSSPRSTRARRRRAAGQRVRRDVRPARRHLGLRPAPPGVVPFAVGAYITAAYWFTSSTSFANPAVTLARAASDTFAGIRPADAPGFIVAQLAGGAAADGALSLARPGARPQSPTASSIGSAPTRSSHEDRPLRLRSQRRALADGGGVVQRARRPDARRAPSRRAPSPATRVHPEVLEAMREVGDRLSSVEAADADRRARARRPDAVTMGCGEQCPVVPGLRRDDWPLEDPKGKPIERVREIRDEVRARVVALLARRDGRTADSPRGDGRFAPVGLFGAATYVTERC